MSQTPFIFENRWNPAAKTRQTMVGASCKCGKTEWAVANSPGIGQKIFSRRGWRVSATKATCPACVGPRLLTAAQKRAAYCRIEGVPRRGTHGIENLGPDATALVPLNSVMAEKLAPVRSAMTPAFTEETPMAAEPPRIATQADNRRILDALAEHYDEARSLYRRAFSDASVAQALNVPRAWVEDVRTRFFGPDTNEAAIERAADLDKAIDLAGKATERLLAMAQDAEKIASELQAERAKLKGKAA